MNDLFLGRCDFPIRLYKLLGQGCVKERLRSSLRKLYGRYGDLIKQYEFPSTECYTLFWMMTIYSDTLYWSGISPIFDLITDLDIFTELDFLPNCEVSIEHLQRVWHANRGRLLLRTPGPVSLWAWKCSNVESNLSWTCLVSGLLTFEHPSVLPFCFERSMACKTLQYSIIWICVCNIRIRVRFLDMCVCKISICVCDIWLCVWYMSICVCDIWLGVCSIS